MTVVPASVLVVDDNAEIRELLGRGLTHQGLQASFAEGGAQALQMMRALPPDLVLLDIMMPGLDGYEVCRRLRADPEMARMTLCALTGYTPSESDRLRPQQAGFDHNFVKPVSMDTLTGLLETLA